MDDRLSFSDALQAQARQLAPHALELVADLAAGRANGYTYRIRPGTMLSAGKLVIALAAGALPNLAAEDVERLEKLRDLRAKQLSLAKEMAVIDTIPKDRPTLAALGHVLDESGIGTREFLALDARERTALITAARQQAQAAQDQEGAPQQAG